MIDIDNIVFKNYEFEGEFLEVFKALSVKLDNIESGKIEQSGGAQTTTEENVKSQKQRSNNRRNQ